MTEPTKEQALAGGKLATQLAAQIVSLLKNTDYPTWPGANETSALGATQFAAMEMAFRELLADKPNRVFLLMTMVERLL
jgi:hypothetical protein